MGFCPNCRTDDPLVEDRRPTSHPAPAVTVALSQTAKKELVRIETGIGELDRVLGGGLVPGSAILLGGEPGVGKSTLMLQAAVSLAGVGRRVMLAATEESVDQVGLRAGRIGARSEEVSVVTDPDVDRIVAAADQLRPDLVVVDSIQTVEAVEVEGSAGGVAQVRECAARLARFGKSTGVSVVLVGHVTKDGTLAGPKLLEHMVDVVLYLEGESDRGFRTLRSLKNRFGPTHVVGLFDMQPDGIAEVPDPSAAFLADWQSDVPGTVIFPAVSGRRAVLVEVQALVGNAPVAQPRRSVRGIEPNRLHQLLAVLERHAGLVTSNREVFVNVVGGLRIDDPAVDLPVALAVASSALSAPLGRLAAWGEVGLAGEVRPVPFDRWRVEEAQRLGVAGAVIPVPGLRIVTALAAAGLHRDPA